MPNKSNKISWFPNKERVVNLLVLKVKLLTCPNFADILRCRSSKYNLQVIKKNNQRVKQDNIALCNLYHKFATFCFPLKIELTN